MKALLEAPCFGTFTDINDIVHVVKYAHYTRRWLLRCLNSLVTDSRVNLVPRPLTCLQCLCATGVIW